MRHRCTIALATLCFLGPGVFAGKLIAQAGPSGVRDQIVVTLDSALALAVERNHSFLARSEAIAVSRGIMADARSIAPNPEAEIELPARLRGQSAGYELVVSQPIEIAGQRWARVDAAAAGAARTSAQIEDARRLLARRVAEVFFTTVAAEQRLVVADELLELSTRTREIVEVQAREGEVSELDASFAVIEQAQAHARALNAVSALDAARLELGLLLGMEEGGSAQGRDVDVELPDPTTLAVDRLVDGAIARRPDLRAYVEGVRSAEAGARLARRERIPRVDVGALVQNEPGDANPAVGLRLSVPVPLWIRGGGVVDQREAQVREAMHLVEAARQRVEVDVAAAYREYATAFEAESVLAVDALAPARAARELLDVAYTEGEMDLPTLIVLRDQLLESELAYWDAWLDTRLGLARLTAAIGGTSPYLTDIGDL